MTLVMLVRVMQLACAACWLFPLLTCWRSVWRVLRGVSRRDDATWSIIWFMACSQLGFIARWFLFGAVMPAMRADELVLWGGMYVLSAAVAVSAMIIIHHSERLR